MIIPVAISSRHGGMAARRGGASSPPRHPFAKERHMKTTTTQKELEDAFAGYVKERGLDVALKLLQSMARTTDLAAVPESLRLLTTAALERRPPAGRVAAKAASPAERLTRLHDGLAEIGAKAFAKRNGKAK